MITINEMNTLLNTMLLTMILIGAIGLLLQWLFIYFAVKHGCRAAILEAYKEIKDRETNPHKYKTPEEDFEEEMRGWS